jgi:hypothetical protein
MASKKQETQLWLEQRGWSLKSMTDDQKLEMRHALNICGAATSSSGYTFPCSVPPMDNGRCRKHGGATPKGAASPNYRGKGFSKYLPKNIAGNYETFLADPNLISLRDEIAVSKARSVDLLGQLNERETLNDFEELSNIWLRFRAAMNRADRAAANAAMQEMDEALEGGAENFRLWNEITKSFELTRRLQQTEAKMMNDMRLTITVESGIAFAMAIVDIVRKHLTEYMQAGKVVDRDLFASISAGIYKLTNSGSKRAIDA